MKLLLTRLCIAAVLGAVVTATAAPTLKVGDPAPPLKVAKWFKGQPVEKLEPSSVYVVEFWATWCGPCKKSIPHLTELAKQFDGKARIIGVSVFEAEETNHEKRLAAVSKFVTDMGDKMDYSVAADDNDGSMAKNWVEAAGETGIPLAFIVGKDGKIAWIGNPWQDMDKRLADTVAGKLDSKAVQAEANQRQADKDARERVRELLKPVGELQEAKKYPEAIAALDKVIAEHSELAEKTGVLRFKLLLPSDEAAAFIQARKLLDGQLKNNPTALYMMGRDLIETPLKTHDWDLCIAVLQRSCELTKDTDPSSLSVLSHAHFGKGNLAQAVKTGELAVRLADADSSYNEGSRTYIKMQLQRYKAAQEKAKPAPTTN
jgi:thiol-disulfide isomerase/thioredoxin